MEVYISASWKERDRVRALANRLREAGFRVYDFTDSRCRKAPEVPPEQFTEQFDPDVHDYKTYIDRPEWRAAVRENRKALDRCDAVVLLLPCGIDATADWAYALGKGKPSVVVGHPRVGERSPVHLWAQDILPDEDACIVWLQNLSTDLVAATGQQVRVGVGTV